MNDDAPSVDIFVEIIGHAGVLTLNRPKALNALTLPMIDAIAAALDQWEHDPKVALIIIRQGASRAFCAGGDIRSLVAQIKAQEFEAVEAFYWREYRLNRRIKRYAKPYIALLDGIVMGGGVGVSVHGRYRVGSEKLLFAMPEVGIGLFPDVGATYFLPRMPGQIGLYLALSGERIGAADALNAGVLTHHVASADLPRLFDQLCEGGEVNDILASFHRDPAPPTLPQSLASLAQSLAQPNLDALLAHLGSAALAGNPQAHTLSSLLSSRSPTSIALAFRQIAEGAKLSFEDCMRLEYRIVSRIIRGHDFCEGVRAVIIDKDNAPRWQPPTHSALDAAVIEAHFDPLAGQELEF